MFPSTNASPQEDSTILCVAKGDAILLPKDLPAEDDGPSPKKTFSLNQLKCRFDRMKHGMKYGMTHVVKNVRLPRVTAMRSAEGLVSSPPRSSLMRTKYIELTARMKQRRLLEAPDPNWQTLDNSEVQSAQNDYGFYDAQFQKRFDLPSLETILLRFPCSFGRSRGSIEATDVHLAFHGGRGVKWILSLSAIRCIQKTGPDSILLCSDSKDYRVSNVKRCDQVVRLLRTLWSPSKEEENSSKVACSAVLQNQIAQFSSCTLLLDTVLPLSMERLLARYLESTHFYRTLLQSGGDFGIQIGQWKEASGGKCCPEKRREVHFQHVYSVFKKQVPCCSCVRLSVIGVIRQHQCMVYHRSAQTITMTIQHTISNIPIYGTLHLLNHWIIETTQDNHVRIRIFYTIEGMQGIALATVRSFIFSQSQQVCKRWIDMIRNKETRLLILPEALETRKACDRRQYSVFLWLVFLLLIVIALYMKKYSVCSTNLQMWLSTSMTESRRRFHDEQTRQITDTKTESQHFALHSNRYESPHKEQSSPLIVSLKRRQMDHV